MPLLSTPDKILTILAIKFIIIALFLFASWNNPEKEGKFVDLDQNIFTAYMPFWKYWNEQVYLHEPFEAFDKRVKRL